MKSTYFYPLRGLGSNWRTSGFFSLLAFLMCFTFSSQAQTSYPGDNLGAAVGPDAEAVTESVATSTLTGTIGTDYTISNVTLDITHTWVADLDISLVAPDGTSLDLSSDNGGSGDNYTNTQFEDDGPDGDIIFGSAPFTGVFTPEDATFADAFDGVDVNGSWTLVIFDDADGDGGTFNNFEITFSPPVTCDVPNNLTVSNITTEDAELSWNDVPSATLGYQWVVMPSGVPPVVDGSETATGTTNSGELMDTVSGLSGGTTYDAYVRAVCSITDSSDWSNVANFFTDPVCGGSFFDNGGPTGNYANDSNETTTISPDSPGDVVYVEFLSFDVEGSWDGLLIYDGPDATAPLIDSGGVYVNEAPDGSWSGVGDSEFSAEGRTFISTHPTGSLTFVFVSDDLVSRAGWEATVTCGPPPTCFEPANLETSNLSATGADLSWDDAPTATLGYEWVVMPSGIEPATDGSEVATGTTNAGELTDSVSGLTGGTSYDAYVRSVCSIEDLSDWSDVASFLTPPANDNFADAIPVTCEGDYSGFTDSATVDGVFSSPNVWYSFTGSGEAELVTLDLCDSDYDTLLRVYTGTAGDLTQIAFNDDSCDLQSQLSFESDGSTTYYISVEGFDASSIGNYDLDVTCNPIVANDDFGDAIPVVCDGNYTGSTDGATIDEDASAPNVWYSFTGAGTAETVNLDLCDSDYDTRIRVYTGTPGDLTEIAENDDSCDLQSQLSFSSDGTTTYYISVEGFDESSTGNYDLDVTCTTCGAPVNLTASNITTTSAELSWEDEPTATLGYEWVVMPSDTEPATDGSQVATGTTNAGELMDSVSGLTGGTSYDAYVRSVCSISDSSDWSEVASFMTIPVLEEVLIVDLSVPNEITIRATTGDAAVTSSGGDSTGFYLEDFFIDNPSQSLSEGLVSGNLTSALNTSDNSPDLFKGSSDSGLNVYSYTDDPTSEFEAGQQAFSGEATWSLSSDEYNAMLAAPGSGIIFFPADSEDDISGATPIGNYTVITSSSTLAFQEIFTDRGVASGAVAFNDVDSDGDQDVFISGALNVSSTGVAGPGSSRIYLNDGTGSFTHDTGNSFSGLGHTSASFYDINDDSVMDLVVAGELLDFGNNLNKFYTNDGSGDFTDFSNFALPRVDRKDFKFADLNGDDGDDLLIIGKDRFSGEPISKIFTNQNSTIIPNLPEVLDGSIDVADIDGDSDLDVFISGDLNGTKISRLYENDGNYQFSMVTGTNFDGVDGGDSGFADIDDDGDQDLLISGLDGSMSNVLKLYLNDGSGSFTEAVGVFNMSQDILIDAFGIADIDGDNDLDILMTGYNTTDFETVTKIWENILYAPAATRTPENTSLFAFGDDNDFGISFKLFPNPTDNGYFNIYAPDVEGEVMVNITDISGRNVMSQNLTISNNNVAVNSEKLSSGVYIVRLSAGEKSFTSKLMVK